MADRTPDESDSFSELFRNLPDPTRPDPVGAAEAAPGSRRALREAAAREAAEREAAERAGTGAAATQQTAADAAFYDWAAEAPAHGTEYPAEYPAETSPAPRHELDDIFGGTARERSEPGKPRKRRRGCLITLIVLLVLFGGIAAAGVWVWQNYGERILEELGWADSKDYEPGQAGEAVYVLIPDGASGCSITTTLFEAGVTKRSDTVCEMLIKSGENPVLHPGIFELRERMPAAEALAILGDRGNILTGTRLRELTLEHAVQAVSIALRLDRGLLPAGLPDPFAEGGFIVGDREFFDAASMSEQQLQTFLDERLPECDGGMACLKDVTANHSPVPANAFCAPLEAGTGEGVARVLETVATSCGLNPKLLLVMLHEPLRFDLVALAAQMTTPIVDGGHIISDAEFFDAGAMSEEEIQAFLEQRVPACDEGFTCLKDLVTDHPNRSADRYCAAMPGGTGESAARIITKVAAACGISPSVLLVMIEKEQALVTGTNPSQARLDHAMGHACPDTGVEFPGNCDPAFAGFATQVYSGARQMQIYVANPNSYHYRAGRVNTIQWHHSPACGTSQVFIQNQATANLYIYTPYRANVASLAAGAGVGDACSSYGNRNFYSLYTSWFAPERAPFLGMPAQVPTCTVPLEQDIVSVNRSARVIYDGSEAREAPTPLCARDLTELAQGTEVTVTGTYGAWSRITVDGQQAWVTTESLEF